MSQNSCPLPMSTPQAPLIDDQDSKHNLVQPQNDVVLEQPLNILETVLNFFGFFQISIFTTLLSWVVFISLAIALPVLRANFLHCSHCEKFEIQTFDLQVAVFQAISAAISLVCISHNLRKYGLRKLLFVDRHHGYVSQFREQYMQRIKFILKEHIATDKFTYLKMKRRFSDYFSTTAVPTFVSVSMDMVLTIVQIVGLVFCLSAAAKLSHRAQGLGSVASRWHALVTCNSGDAPLSFSANNSGILNDANPMGSSFASCSESDLESFDNQAYPTINHTQITSVMSTYHKRQAFVAYVQSNTGGFTIFGWLFDRVLVNTIFFIELSFVMFVLGKTIAIPVR
ncbi:hypothetical protein Leryth_015331 [Lithospermum erythrorhizon]|nr:hypothetical protein Leryth_015331 [Lithospermum erythrorhizon]